MRPGQGILELCPFYEILIYPYVLSLRRTLLPQFSSYPNETWYTWSSWSVYVQDIPFMRPGPGVPELCPFYEILIYPCVLSLHRKLYPQFASYHNETWNTWSLWSLDVQEIFHDAQHRGSRVMALLWNYYRPCSAFSIHLLYIYIY